MRELREGLESAVERRTGAAAGSRLVPVAPVAGALDEATTRVPDPTSVPLAEPVSSPSLGTTGARGVGRRRRDRTRARLLTAAAIAAVLLGVALALSARHPESESVAAGALRPSPAGQAAGAAPAPRSLPGATARRSPSPAASHAAVAPSPAGAATSSPRAEEPAEEPEAAPEAPRATPAAATPAPASPPEAGEEDAEPAPTTGYAPSSPFGGRWQLTHEVESSSYGPYAGMTLGYRLTLFQDGDRVYGQGRKVSENGVPLPPGQRTPIDVAGRIENGQLVLHFTELGARRTSRGTIRWQLEPDSSVLHGRFDSDAANSNGTSSARRLP
jgi:hypothetical protein